MGGRIYFSFRHPSAYRDSSNSLNTIEKWFSFSATQNFLLLAGVLRCDQSLRWTNTFFLFPLLAPSLFSRWLSVSQRRMNHQGLSEFMCAYVCVCLYLSLYCGQWVKKLLSGSQRWCTHTEGRGFKANYTSTWIQRARVCACMCVTWSSVDVPDSLPGTNSVVRGVVRDEVFVAPPWHPWAHLSG